MKKIFLFIAMIASSSALFSQAIEVSNVNPTISSPITTSLIDVHVSINVPNGTTLRWYRYDLNTASGWNQDVPVCDDFTCHAPSTNFYTFVTNGSTGLKLSFNNNGNVGTSSAKVALFNPSDSAGTVTVINFTAIATNETSIFDSKENNNIKLKVFPNPASSIIYLDIDPINSARFVEVFNMLGSKVLSADINTSFGFNSLDVATLPQDLYVVRVQDIKGNILKATNFTKK